MKSRYQLLNALQDIEKKYDTYFIDVAGVIYDGQNPFGHAVNIINKLLSEHKQIIFLSNNPWPAQFTQNKLQACGITGNYRIVTSGDLLHHTLATTLANKKIYHLGRNREHALLEGTNAHITPSLSDADAVIISCFVEGNESHDIFNTDLENILASGKPIYCPNPDRLALEGALLRYPSGYFAHKLTQCGCPIIYLGKPSRILYDFITHIHSDIIFTLSTTLMIGDTLETDICGAINFGIDSLLVLSGITGLRMKKNVHAILESLYQPTYVMDKLL